MLPAVDPSSSFLFVLGASLSGEELLRAAARVRVKPSALQGPLPFCVLCTKDAVEAKEALAEARAVGLSAWSISMAEAAALDRAITVTIARDGADLHTSQRVRRVTAAGLVAFVDLRWRGRSDRRLQLMLPSDAAAVLVRPDDLVIEGPSRQGGILRLQNELQRHFASLANDRVLALGVTPPQLGVSPETPPELVASALAVSFRATPQGTGRR